MTGFIQVSPFYVYTGDFSVLVAIWSYFHTCCICESAVYSVTFVCVSFIPFPYQMYDDRIHTENFSPLCLCWWFLSFGFHLKLLSHLLHLCRCLLQFNLLMCLLNSFSIADVWWLDSHLYIFSPPCLVSQFYLWPGIQKYCVIEET